jgi:ATP-binding cassette, subfamily B, bacterial
MDPLLARQPGGNPYVSLLRTAWRYARHQRSRFVFIYALFGLANLLAAFNPLLFGWFVDQVQRRGTADLLAFAGLYAGGYVLLKLAEWACHGPARVMERQLAFDLSRNFLAERYHQALHLPVKWHQDHHSGATINRIRKAYEALKHFFEGGFMYLHALFKFLFSFGAMLYFSPVFGGIGIALGALTVWVIFKFDKPFIQALDETNEKEHVVSATLFDSLSNIITVITLRLEQRMQAGLMGKVADIFRPYRRQVLINEWKWFVADMLVTLTYATIALGYVYQHWAPGQVFYVGGLVALLGYVNQFTSVFHDVAWQYTQIVQYNTDVQTAAEIDTAYREQHRPEATEPLSEDWKVLEISGLHFTHRETYHGGQTPHGLHGLHLRVGRGQRVALIGESGSGKSTLLALLRGLYQPEPGAQLRIDGRAAPGLAPLTDSVTLFPQEPEIFENTIEYNITLGLPFGEAEVLQVCDTAHFAEVVAQLPRGLESSIQEKGVNLSGGQKQRLALARGVLAARGSALVLLDEPTSSVDPKTEVQIYDKLFAEFADKAVVSSLHRLYLLPKFDYVYVLAQGRVVAEGTFEHLREHSPAFQALWRHQAEAQATELGAPVDQ